MVQESDQEASLWTPGQTQNMRDCISHLAWEYLGIPQEEWEEVAGEKHVWVAAGWMDGLYYAVEHSEITV